MSIFELNIEYIGEQSNREEPLAFFEYFFTKGYLQNVIRYSNTEGIIVDGATNQTLKPLYEDLVERFNASIPNLIKEEVEKSVKLTKKILLKKETKEGQMLTIHTLFVQMSYIIHNKVRFIPEGITLKVKDALMQYFQDIYQLFPELINNKTPAYKHYFKLPERTNASYSLKMRADKFKRLDKLLDLLKENECVESELSLEQFQKVFDGNLITEPTLGIKWMKKTKGRTHLGSLVVMINLLHDMGYIDNYNDTQLSRIFIKGCGVKDNSISVKNWSVARYQAKSSDENSNTNDVRTLVKLF